MPRRRTNVITKGELLELLTARLHFDNIYKMGKSLGISVNNWQAHKQSPVSRLVLDRAIKKILDYRMKSSIEPIAEFHVLDFFHGRNKDNFNNRIDDLKITQRLKSTNDGIYIFFDTAGRPIYIGKTNHNLFVEMNQRFNGKKVHFKILKDGKRSNVDWKIGDVASYFSDYKVSPLLVKNLEALVTRIMINDTNSSSIRVENFHPGQ